MTFESREEQLSAYLDGELSASERAEVEGWLAESAELRQLRDELVAVRTEMQRLPRHKLERDLGPAVLRAAETLGAEQKPAAGEGAQVGSLVPSWWLKGAGWRRLVWPAAAVAAALLIMAYDAQVNRQQERQVATAPKAHQPEEKLALSAREERGAPSLQAAPAAPAESAPPAIEAAPGQRASEKDATTGAAAGNIAQKRSMRAMTEGSGSSHSAAAPSDEKPPAEPEIVLGVSHEFLQGQKLEELLDERHLPWQRVEPLAAKSVPSKPAESLRQPAELPPTSPAGGAIYRVELTPEELSQLLAELRKTANVVTQSQRPLSTNQFAQEESAPAQRVQPEPAEGDSKSLAPTLHVRFRLQPRPEGDIQPAQPPQD